MASASERVRSLDELPLDVVTNILVFLGRDSTIDVIICKRVSTTSNTAGRSDVVYRNLETDRLTSGRYWGYVGHSNTVDRCRAVGNPNIRFIDGMNRYFYRHDDAGLQMLEEAAADGKKEANFVLGMLMLAEGEARKPEALQLLNATYLSQRNRTEIRVTSQNVEFMMLRNGRREVAFHGSELTCTRHTSSRVYGLVM